MIEQIDMLCRVKNLHEQKKLRVLRTKRAAVEVAAQEEEKQDKIVTESRDALPGTEKALYDAIMRTTVSVNEIDETKAKVQKAQEEHQRLEDEAERLTQIRIRCEQERDEARTQYQIAQRDNEKFMTIQADCTLERARAVETQEEAEIEDLFSKGQGTIT